MQQEKVKDICCQHRLKSRSNKTIEETYCYRLSEEQRIWLCPVCNMMIAKEIMGQLAYEVFT